jgi:predicted AlkP superfamily pyrophosphatase or phosphodiesterase
MARKVFTKDYQPQVKWLEEDALLLANDFIAWLKEADENIFVDDFLFLSCDETKYAGNIYATLPNYLCDKFESFSNLYEKALKLQETKLLKFGVFDKLNAQMTKFVLTNCHGWADTQKTDITTNGKDLEYSVTLNLK